MFNRLIKSDWGKPTLPNGEVNPKFVEEIKGPDVLEGCFTPEYVKEMNSLGYNAYFFPNHPDSNLYVTGVKFLSGKHIKVFNLVFVDMDLKDKIYSSKEEFFRVLSEFKIKPTLTVESGHGVHAYWQIENLTREQYVITQLALINHFRTDESIWTVLQLMRVPGSLNTKEYGNYKEVLINEELSSGNQYSLDDFPAQMFAIPKELQIKAENHINKLDGKVQIQLQEDVNLDELPDIFLDMMYSQDNVYQLFNNPTEFYGDRSGADMKLINILYSKGISKKDALAVAANTQKALSKGANRFDYAYTTVDKAYVDRTKNKFQTVGSKLRNGFDIEVGELVNGPFFFDYGVLHSKWKKTHLLGLIAGTGVGKTAISLKIIKDTIENNVNNDDVFVFVTLEMPEQEIIERWINLVGHNSPLADRLYVIGNEDDKGEPRNIGLQEIHEYCTDIKKATGKNIGAIAIDHMGVISKHIDTRKKYTFGVQSEQGTGWGDIRTLSINTVATQLKTLSKLLNTFLIVLTQTTKLKGQGDTPIDKDGAFGMSDYEKIMDYIITAWQPLMRVQDRSPFHFLAWQYAKIRHKHKFDKIRTHQQKLLTYDMENGNLRPPTDEEYIVFQTLLPEAIKIREDLEKKKQTPNYSKSIDLNELQKVTKNLQIVQNSN